MKNLMIVLSVILLSYNSYAQTLSQNIQEIRKQFKWINSQKDFEKVYFENDEFTDQLTSEGGQLDVFFKNNNIYKIVENFGASTQVYTTEYYLKNNRLIFVYSKETRFLTIPETGEQTKPEVYYEGRVYYKDGKIIRQLKKGESAIDKPIDYQERYNTYKKLIDTKIKYPKRYAYLQGIWINADDIDDWFEVVGIKATHYNQADYYKTSRIWFDGRFLWFHNTEYKEEDKKYEVLNWTNKILEMQDRLTGEVLAYRKKEE